MKTTLYLFLLLGFLSCSLLVAEDPDSNEVLFVRRIMELWKENESRLVQSQIKQFLSQYPHSEFEESLQAILGDALHKEKNYSEALKAYEAILSSTLKAKIFAHRIDCLYHLDRFETLSQEIKPRLPADLTSELTSEEQLWVYYYAEALLQKAKKCDNPFTAKGCYEQALPYFTTLLHSDHQLNAKLALAEIAIAMGEHQKASDIYFELAESYPDKKEEVLFYAARVQSADPKQAIFLYSYVQGFGGHYASEAAWNKSVLMHEQQQFLSLIQEQEELKRLIVLEKHPSFDLLIGQSHFALKQYDKCIETLKPLLKLPQNVLGSQNEKRILLLLMACAYHMNNLPEIQALKVHFKIAFPEDTTYAHVLYLEALALRNGDRFHEAQANLEQIFREYSFFEKMESVEFEFALLLYRQGQWEQSRNRFIAFVRKHPDSPYHLTALQHIPNATTKRLEKIGEDPELRTLLLEQLVLDLELLLDAPRASKPLQKPKYLLQLCKTLYELKRYDQALDKLISYINCYPHDESLYQAHLLAAMCYQKEDEDKLKFIIHAEKVLQLKPESVKTNHLRMSLFNTYLELTKLQEEEEGKADPALLEKGVEHLFVLVKGSPSLVPKEQQLWLANYYYCKALALMNEYAIEPIQDEEQLKTAEKAVVVFLSALEMQVRGPIPMIPADHLYIEQELLKLSNLYGWLNNQPRQVEILKNVIQQQGDNPLWAWKQRSRALFALAYALQDTPEVEQSKGIYTLLTTTMKAEDLYILNASRLQLARLTFASLPASKKNPKDPDVMAILSQLKEIQVKKKAALEPIHLEAGWEYALILASLEVPKKQAEQLRASLIRLKQDFTQQEDVASKDYHLQRQQLPGKDLMYQAYMMLIDASLARLDAQKGKLMDKKRKGEAARSLYTHLLQGKFAVSKYLIKQAEAGLTNLDKIEN